MERVPAPADDFIRGLVTRKLPLAMAFVAGGTRNRDLPQSSSVEIAVVGRSNVGKSSLLNFLAGQKNLARVSRTPGRTQAINLFSVEKGRFGLVDLPGYGYAESSKATQEVWQNSMEEFFSERKGLFACLFLIDVRRNPTDEDVSLFMWLKSLGLQVLVIETKIDKVSKRELAPARKAHGETLGIATDLIVPMSSEKQMGRPDLYRALAEMFLNYKQNIIR